MFFFLETWKVVSFHSGICKSLLFASMQYLYSVKAVNITLLILNSRRVAEKYEFYSLLDSTLCEISKGCTQVIIGNYDAKIGHEECLKPIIGDHNLHQVLNYNGKG